MKKISLYFISITALLFIFKDTKKIAYGAIFFFIAGYELIILSISRKRNSREPDVKENNEVFANEDFHNDFSQVGSGDRNIQVKPVDQSGDVYAHGRESIREDLQNMGIDSFKK